MTVYEELKARGLIAQVTNEPEISEMINYSIAQTYRFRARGLRNLRIKDDKNDKP